MSTIVTRSGKGSPLTNTEVDTNFTNLNTDKVQVTGSPTSGQAIIWNGTAWVPGASATYPGAGIANSTGTAWGTSYGTSGATSVVLRDANVNASANTFFSGFSNVAAAGTTTTLTVSSVYNWVVTGSGGQTYQLPDATTLPNGAIYTFNNNQSSGTIVVKNNSSTTIATIQSGGFVEVLLLSNATTAGSWDTHNQAPASVSWSTNTLDYAGSITSATWNGTAVAINRGGTGQTTATTAFNALAPTQTSNSGKFLTTDGTNTSWATVTAGVSQIVAGSNVTISPTGGTGVVTINAAATTGSYTRTAFTATSGQTSFTVTYTVGYLQVYLNGVLLNSTDYTATSGTSIILATGATTGDIVEVIAYNAIALGTLVSTGVLGGSNGQLLTSNGTNSYWANAPVTPLTTGVTGTLPVANGGTNLTSFTANGVVYASSTSALATGSGITYNGTTFSTTNDASISGLTVGRGAGAVSSNTTVGLSALAANSTGINTAAFGYQALYSNTTASNNTSVGAASGYFNTTGSDNVFVGGGTAFYNTTGSYNTALGRLALFNNTTASNNTAVGYQAGYSNTTGTYNTFHGMQSGYSNTTGGNNTNIGYAANFSNSTGNSNVSIGYQSLNSNTVSNITAVGYQAGYSNTTGAELTAVGSTALKANTTGNSNTAFGERSLQANTTGNQNTASGSYSLANNTTGSYNVAHGREALAVNTTGTNNTAIGTAALSVNTTASNNTAVGYQAGYGGTTSGVNTYLGTKAGYTGSTGDGCTFVGYSSGYYATGTINTFVGYNSGSLITSGTKNTILGGYNGNQGSLDIRTVSNYIVLSDGDGNPLFGANNNKWFWANQGGASTPYYGQNEHRFNANVVEGTRFFCVSTYPTSNEDSIVCYGVSGTGYNTAATALRVSKNSSTNRSINAAGTVNASGADYAEYMTKAGDFAIAKGDVIGINAEGKLTNVFADAVSFVVKSTDPSYVGGDGWGVPQPKDENNIPLTSGSEYDAWAIAQEAARQAVDRIAFSGQVPVNVTGATAGQYIIPINDNGAIKGVAKNEADLTMSDYIKSVGKVVAIEADGRARIIVKVA